MAALESLEPAGPGLAHPAGLPPDVVSTAAWPPARPRQWRPWPGRPRARDLLCLAGITLSGLYGLAMIALTPGLIATRPVLLELLSGSTTSIVAAGAFAHIASKLQLTVVIAAGLPGLMKFDLLFWWAGVLWGHRIVELLARHSRHAAAFARQAEQRGSGFAATGVLLSAFLPVPTPLVYAAAGWAGLRLHAGHQRGRRGEPRLPLRARHHDRAGGDRRCAARMACPACTAGGPGSAPCGQAAMRPAPLIRCLGPGRRSRPGGIDGKVTR